jgi:glutamate racemase
MKSPHIGVFDSGFGGLTVLSALLKHIPHACYTFLGDTARLPYGSKSRRTIAHYASEAAQYLVKQGAEYLVIACNTASALALDAIQDAVPVVLVIATAATVQSHAYASACHAQGLRAIEKACPLLVPLVEEGWTDHPVTRQVIDVYLSELREEARGAGLNYDTLVLGCTHYPLIRKALEEAVTPGVRVIDSAEATAEAAMKLFGQSDAERTDTARIRCFATDSVEKFERLGSRFLGRPTGKVELVDLGG